jgi:hypothetical protein
MVLTECGNPSGPRPQSHSDKLPCAYPVDSTSPKGWGSGAMLQEYPRSLRELECSSVTRPPVGAHNDRLIYNVALPRRRAMATFQTLLGLGSQQQPTTCKQLYRVELNG